MKNQILHEEVRVIGERVGISQRGSKSVNDSTRERKENGMKKYLAVLAIAAMVVGGASVTYAAVCATDVVPAATLLFPFVQLDYNNPVDGDTTLFAITNVSSEAQIVHVTVWTEYSTAILDFNILLSGYDVQTMNIRDILINGDLPNTGSAYSPTLDYDFTKPFDPVNGTTTPFQDGPVSYNNDAYTGPAPADLPGAEGTSALDASGACSPNNPSYPDYPIIGASTLATFQDYLTLFQLYAQYGLLAHTDCDIYNAYNIGDWWETRTLADPTWMYITADVVQACNKEFPSSAAYWTAQLIDYDNVLIGDVFWVNNNARFSEADNAVHIEAADPQTVLLNHAFYDGVEANGAADGINGREPLPTAWAMRYIGVGSSAMDTYIRAWKNWNDIYPYYDGNNNLIGYNAADCLAYTLYMWDEDENFKTTSDDPWSAPGIGTLIPNFLPIETQEVKADQFNTPDADGWMLFIWPSSNINIEPDFYEAWMGVKYAAYGNYSAALSGAVIANYNCFPNQVLPNLGLNDLVVAFPPQP